MSEVLCCAVVHYLLRSCTYMIWTQADCSILPKHILKYVPHLTGQLISNLEQYFCWLDCNYCYSYCNYYTSYSNCGIMLQDRLYINTMSCMHSISDCASEYLFCWLQILLCLKHPFFWKECKGNLVKNFTLSIIQLT